MDLGQPSAPAWRRGVLPAAVFEAYGAGRLPTRYRTGLYLAVIAEATGAAFNPQETV
ncbi:MAG: hypothetical protein ACREVH_05155 [Gammaproteobacteria bacterium]